MFDDGTVCRAMLLLSIAAAVCCGTAGHARAGAPCEPGWSRQFHPGDFDGDVLASVVFDDGSGPTVYIGGSFTIAGGRPANRIAKWNGDAWEPLGIGTSGSVFALAVYDDGNGPALYAGGAFVRAGGQTVNKIARWDGAEWHPVGTGIASFFGGSVYALAVFDDGSGPVLCAGGSFLQAGGAPALLVAKWNGANWSAIGSGIVAEPGADIRALATIDHGSGPRLVAGGSFYRPGPGDTATSGLLQWDGEAWTSCGELLNSEIFALTTFDDGSGPRLIASGIFILDDIQYDYTSAAWDGANWAILNGPPNRVVSDFEIRNEAGGPALYAGGWLINPDYSYDGFLARLDGTTWSDLGTDLSAEILTLVSDPHVAGGAMIAGGAFTKAGQTSVNHVARWEEGAWSPLGSADALHGLSTYVHELLASDGIGGAGPRLYAAGDFHFAGACAAERVASWNGKDWSPLAGGIAGLNDTVRSLAAYDSGSGLDLYVGGYFAAAGGVPANNVARWDGLSWSPLGAGVNGLVESFAVFDDGRGPALYVGGAFSHAGGQPASGVARWDGTSWEPLGAGVWHIVGQRRAAALAVHDDGTGPALFVAGNFAYAGDVAAISIAKWDGHSWTALDPGLGYDSFITTLAVFDDGSGSALYAGGQILDAGGLFPWRNIAKWDGNVWSHVGGGANGAVISLSTFDDGTGSALHAVGHFTEAGGSPAMHAAKWDGMNWTELGGGVSSPAITSATFDDGAGPALFVGGLFTRAGGLDNQYIARWGCVTERACPGDADKDGGVDLADIAAVITRWSDIVRPGSSSDVDGDGVIGMGDLGGVIMHWGEACE